MTQVSASPYTFAREAMTADLWDRLDPMFDEHWREIGSPVDVPRDPDVPTFLGMEAAGTTRWFIARLDREPIGYIAFFVMLNPKSRQTLQAVCDRFYVHPDHRGETSKSLLSFAEDQLRTEGVQVISVGVPPGLAGRSLLVWAGYKQAEITYVKRLDR